jgi:hypothetical protein
MMLKVSITVLAWLYLLLATGSFIILVIGTFGLFGQARDPLSGAFAIILGQPWVMLVNKLPDALKFFAAAATPFLNAAILFVIARSLRR